jgi:anti-sigma regulatory factor (Ser/Thr protein kinase)
VSDEVTLTLPAEEDFRRVAHLVLGGLAVRLDLTWESLEDLQLALDSLLERREDENEITIGVRVEGAHLHARVGPFPDGVVSDLEQGDGEIGLGRVLTTVCDSFQVVEREGGRWVELVKTIETGS